jgi:hypothetical protein
MYSQVPARLGTSQPCPQSGATLRWPVAYLEQFDEATARAVAAGFLLQADAGEITAIAAINSPSW